MLLFVLQLDCHTIETKPNCPQRRIIRIDSEYIDANHQAFGARGIASVDKRITAENKGFQMMKQLGWSGGALGTSGTGIEEPIQVQMRANRRGLGIETTESTHATSQQHWVFFDNYLRAYAGCDSEISQLAVHMSYSQKEWRTLAKWVEMNKQVDN